MHEWLESSSQPERTSAHSIEGWKIEERALWAKIVGSNEINERAAEKLQSASEKLGEIRNGERFSGYRVV